MVRAMNVTRLRSISLIFPAATSRSSASALHWGTFSISHSSRATGHSWAQSLSRYTSHGHQAHCHHFDLNGTIEGVELAGASDFAAGLCVVIASGALPGGS